MTEIAFENVFKFEFSFELKKLLKLVLYLRQQVAFAIDDMLCGNAYVLEDLKPTNIKKVTEFEGSLIRMFEQIEFLFKFWLKPFHFLLIFWF